MGQVFFAIVMAICGFLMYQIYLDETDPDRVAASKVRVETFEANYMSGTRYFKDANQDVCFAMFPNRDAIAYVPCERLEAPTPFVSK